jgi:hypothetical protein
MTCIGNDAFCPCHDGDACHYVDLPGSPAMKAKTCDDARIMQLWREVGLPEYFLGNGGTNYKLLAFARRCSEVVAA